jgi:hypothetical protein
MKAAGRCLTVGELRTAMAGHGAAELVSVDMDPTSETIVRGVHPVTGHLSIECDSPEPDEDILDFIRAVADGEFARLTDARSDARALAESHQIELS